MLPLLPSTGVAPPGRGQNGGDLTSSLSALAPMGVGLRVSENVDRLSVAPGYSLSL